MLVLSNLKKSLCLSYMYKAYESLVDISEWPETTKAHLVWTVENGDHMHKKLFHKGI